MNVDVASNVSYKCFEIAPFVVRHWHNVFVSNPRFLGKLKGALDGAALPFFAKFFFFLVVSMCFLANDIFSSLNVAAEVFCFSYDVDGVLDRSSVNFCVFNSILVVLRGAFVDMVKDS